MSARHSDLIDQFTGAQLGADLARVPCARPTVVESALRLRPEVSYSYVHALWWLWLTDGRSVVSVPPGAGPAVEPIVAGVASCEQLADSALAERLITPVSETLSAAGIRPVDGTHNSIVFACDGALLRRHDPGACVRLADPDMSVAEGIWFPAHCLPDGVAYGVVADGRLVSVAYAHRTGLLEDCVADVGVETSPAYRRRGYARACVASVVAEMASRGGQARYSCSPGNAASIATARSVGFAPYATSLVLTAPGQG